MTVGALVAGLLSCAWADTVSVPVLTAAFLFNFVSFAEWPTDSLAPGQRLSLCVIGDNAVADALERTVKGHTGGGHELTVEVTKADGRLRSCHLLYATGLDVPHSLELIRSLQGGPVLTVSDRDKFGEAGGIVQLIIENDRMHFAINPAAASRAHVRLSSKLLRLATIVKDEPVVHR